MAERPVGTLTLLFTDIEGSTRLLQRLGDAYASLLADHHHMIREALAAAHGVEVKTEGDAFFVVFHSAIDAVVAAVAAQRALATHRWPEATEVRVRMGIHTGDIALSGDEYVGLDVHRAARIAATAHGGQIVFSEPTYALVQAVMPEGVTARDLGLHRLKDIDETEHLYQLGVVGLVNEFPPLRSLSARLAVLPSELGVFVGRERELERVSGLLERTRLLTLTGPGGTGKTRLSLAVIRRLDDRFGDGVAFVELAPITNPELVAPTIRQALGYREETGRMAIDTLVERLNGKDVLLTLDNFEQVLPAASLVAELLARTEHLKVLVTSRSPLHVDGEQEFTVPPLELPSADDPTDVERVSQSEAVRLFVQRARTIDSDFTVTPQNAAAIVEICRRLDGLPLAIELAASRIRLLPPIALLARLKNRLDLLQSTAADRTDRQRTLRGAIDWSYELLEPDERSLFRRLAIFVGGWALDDVDGIADAAGRLARDSLDGLSALIDHSLVRQTSAGEEPRSSMLETIREFGLERLAAAGELEATAKAHAERFAALALEAEPHLTAGPEWADRLEREHDNVRGMVGWVMAGGDSQLGLRAGGALWRFWHVRGHIREGRAVLTALLALPASAPQTIARAKALEGLAGLEYWMGDYLAARRGYEEQLAIAREIGDRRTEADALYSLGYIEGIERGYGAARDAYQGALQIYTELGDANGSLRSHFGLGFIWSLLGEWVTAREQLEATLREARAQGDTFMVRNTLATLGRAYLALGDIDRADDLFGEMLQNSIADEDVTSIGMAIYDKAAIASARGDHRRAMRLVGADRAIGDLVGARAPQQLVLTADPVAPAIEALGEEEAQRARDEGRAMSVDEAIEYAQAHVEDPAAVRGPPVEA